MNALQLHSCGAPLGARARHAAHALPLSARPSLTAARAGRPQRRAASSLHRSVQRCNVAAAVPLQTVEVGKLISQTDIPPFIPRTDLMQQLYRWALYEIQESGTVNFGLPMKV